MCVLIVGDAEKQSKPESEKGTFVVIGFKRFGVLGKLRLMHLECLL